MEDHFLTTHSGLRFSFDRPAPEQVSVDDLAVALGNTCRFGGHVRHFYSVAEHAMLVCTLVRQRGLTGAVTLAALHHDSHEAYLGDCPTPLKEKIKLLAPGMWETMEAEINVAIAKHIGFDPALFDHPYIRDADRRALALEGAVLKVPGSELCGLEGVDLEPYRAQADELVEGLRPEDAAVDFRDYHDAMMRRWRDA